MMEYEGDKKPEILAASTPLRGGPRRPWKDVERDLLALLTPEQLAWVEKKLAPAGRRDLLKMDRAELLAAFPGEPTDEPGQPPQQTLNDSLVVQLLTWQLGVKILAGEVEPLHGNMRTGWYRLYEPFYLDNNLLESDVGDPIALLKTLELDFLEDALLEAWQASGDSDGSPLTWLAKKSPTAARKVTLAAREGYVINLISQALDALFLQAIFDLDADFGLQDPGESYRFIGRKRARWLLYTEKEGLLWLCRAVSKAHSISAMASRGQSTYLGLWFLYQALVKANVHTVDVGAVTDYDPWGAQIAVGIVDKLSHPRYFGPGKVTLTHLDGTQEDLKKLFTREQLLRARRDLTRYHKFKQKEVDDWVKVTGGIDGGAYGVHVDLANRAKLRAMVDDWAKKEEVLETPPEGQDQG